jgi:hypothetical protein
MAYQSIGLGTTAGDGTGDSIRDGGDKVNDNFVEIYTALGTGTALSSGISATATVITLASPVITGVLSLADGSVSAPAFTNNGDTNTGIYFSAADTVSVTTGGTKRIDIDSSGLDVTGAITATTTITASAGVVGTTGTFSSDVTGLTLNATGDTSASDNAAIGYTSAEGLILTGQGSTSDVTLKNDADGTVFTVPTGTDDILFPDSAKAMWGAGSDLQIYHDGSHSYIVDNATGNLKIQGSQVDILGSGETMATFVDDGAVTLYYDNTAALATASAAVNITGDLTATLTIQPAGDTAAGDNAAIGYTSAEGLILTGQGSTSDITLKNDADGTVFTVPTGTDDILFPDSAKAMWGASSDLEIYHDGSNSYIVDGGTGNLKIYASQLDILGTAETMATFVDDGAVSLYHNNGVKIATTATGIQVTGTALATTDTDTSNTGSITLDFTANQNFVLTFTGNVTLANPTTEQVGQAGVIVCIQDGTGSRTLSLGTDYETAAAGGITLSTAANSVDVIPYFVKAAGSIQLGAVQLAFA